MKPSNKLAEAPIRSLFFSYYVPALTTILSTTIHQLVNGVILGQQVGKDGLAAVGLYGPVMVVFIALTLPVMIGGGILISKSIGAASYDTAQAIFQFATTLGLVAGGCIGLSAPFVYRYMATWLVGSGNPALVGNMADYMLWQLIGMPFFFLRMFWGNYVSNDGAPQIAKNASLLAVGLNIGLDVLLIMGLHLGVEGASIATTIAIFGGTLYLFMHIQKGKYHVGFVKFRFTLRLHGWKELLMLGFPSFASELAFSTGLLLINQSLIRYGALAVSTFGLVNYLSFVFIRVFTAAMIAALPIMSFNIGAKQPHRVLQTLRFALGFTLVLGLLFTALGFLTPDLLIALFASDKTESFRQMANWAIALYFLLFLTAGPNYILAAYLQSIGKTTASTLINVLKGFVLIALLLMLLPDYFNMGLSGIWLSRSLAELLAFCLVGLYTFLKKETYYSEAAIVSNG